MASSVHIIAHGFPPCSEAGAKTLMKILHPLNRDAEIKLKITTAHPAMYAERDDSLAGYAREFELNYVRWLWQRPYEIVNQLVNWHTDPYLLFAWRCQSVLRRSELSDLYFLRGQYFSTFLLAPFIRHTLKRPVVLYFSDPWLCNPFIPWTARLKKRVARLEALAMESASGAIFTNAPVQEATLANYPHLRLRSLVLPHVYLDALYEKTINREFGNSKNGRIVFTYAGSFYRTRQPWALFEAMAELKREQPALLQNFVLRLIGPSLSLYQQRIKELGIAPHVHLHGSKSYLETLRELQKSDVLVNIDAPSELSLFLPSKLIDYIGCKLPIWTISPAGPSASLIAEYRGLVSPPNDVAAIKKDLALCLERVKTQSWNLNFSFAEQFESQKRAVELKNFLQKILDQESSTQETKTQGSRFAFQRSF